MAEKERLDVLLVSRGLFGSRERARAAIMGGDVYVDGQKAEKPGTGFRPDAAIEVREKAVPYVSRGGLKLEKALREFSIGVSGLRVLDGGASTGGFTDCLLKHGASRVWAVDVGYGQLAWELRNDPRVVCVERTNIRSLTEEHLDGGPADMAVLDLSFISLSLVLPVIRAVLTDGAPVICLVKPQFEAGRDKVGKHGVVRSPETHCEVLQGHFLSAREAGFGVKQITFSPIKGPKGNIEYLSYLAAGAETALPDGEMERAVEMAHRELL
ncbi:MAG: TlyA family RNA methyltransferase [Oscillospiraceae bacterium]|jgi:23S rRNA (cytidine1920-2'-O)/16S rRNA (cytidine1409-2'-O)-methyltransferase|nr:TlyA family RNA methyltransferase [Oscillospiraceae bacterium]